MRLFKAKFYSHKLYFPRNRSKYNYKEKQKFSKLFIAKFSYSLEKIIMIEKYILVMLKILVGSNIKYLPFTGTIYQENS